MEWQTPFNLPFLKTLNMFVLTSPSLNAFKLIQGCPILESLSLTVSDRSLPEDYIFNIPTLKHLKLEVTGKCHGITKVVLNVPNLEDIFIGGQWCSQFVIEDFLSLVSVKFSFVLWIEHLWVELLKGISGAKSISFKPDFGYRGAPLPIFLNYENLELISWYKLKWIPIVQILESCYRLEHLCIEEQKDKPTHDKISEESHWIEPKSVPACMLMNLKTIKFKKCMGRKDDIQFLEYMMGNAKVLKTLTIMCDSGVMEEEFRLCAKLLKCPRASKYCEIHFIAKSLDSATC